MLNSQVLLTSFKTAIRLSSLSKQKYRVENIAKVLGLTKTTFQHWYIFDFKIFSIQPIKSLPSPNLLKQT